MVLNISKAAIISSAWFATAITENTYISLGCAGLIVAAVFKAGMELRGIRDKLEEHDRLFKDQKASRTMDIDMLRSELPRQHKGDTGEYPRFKLLIVDDNSNDRLLFRRMLNKAFDIHETDSLVHATEWMHKEDFDCVLLDLSLSDTKVEETVAEFLKFNPAALCVAMSGYEGFKSDALKQGADSFMLKKDMDGDYAVRIVRHAIIRRRNEG